MKQLFLAVKGRLYRSLPMLALPLGLLEPREADVEWMGTDGRRLFIQRDRMEASVRKRDGEAEELLLHCVLHCILGHPWQRRGRDEALWSLACDMAVVFLQGKLRDRKETDPVILEVERQCPGETIFHAPTLYRLLKEEKLRCDKEVRAAFHRDDHSPWRQGERRMERRSQTGEGLDHLWQRQQEKLRPYMKRTPPRIGQGTQGRKLALPEFAQIPACFSDLLGQFASVQENRRVNDGDFSYLWYVYGMEHYEGMPLVEPLEYSEERRLREMVIVLDTSGSCSRGLIACFLGAVQEILCRERLFFERFHLHILQCDCKVHQDQLVTNLEEFQDYMENLELYGGGGTDFCPAFCYIDELVAAGEFTRLAGILYFSDGLGVFPREQPEYPVAFVMMKNRYDDIDIPDWAIKLVLDLDMEGEWG